MGDYFVHSRLATEPVGHWSTALPSAQRPLAGGFLSPGAPKAAGVSLPGYRKAAAGVKDRSGIL